MNDYVMPMGKNSVASIETYMAAHPRKFSILNDHGVKFLRSSDLAEMTLAAANFGAEFSERLPVVK